MAAIRRRGKRWHAEVRVRGVRSCRSFATKAEAQAWAVDVERRIRERFTDGRHDLECAIASLPAEPADKPSEQGVWFDPNSHGRGGI